jgi:hypothetical protein
MMAQNIARFLPFEGLVKDVGLTGNYADKTKPLQVPSLVGVFIFTTFMKATVSLRCTS